MWDFESFQREKLNIDVTLIYSSIILPFDCFALRSNDEIFFPSIHGFFYCTIFPLLLLPRKFRYNCFQHFFFSLFCRDVDCEFVRVWRENCSYQFSLFLFLLNVYIHFPSFSVYSHEFSPKHWKTDEKFSQFTLSLCFFLILFLFHNNNMIFCAFLGRKKWTPHTEKVSQVSDVSKENAVERKTFSCSQSRECLNKISFWEARSEENYFSIKFPSWIIFGE